MNMFSGKKNIFLIVLFLLLSRTDLIFASNIQFEATVDNARVSLGSSIQLNLSFYGTQNVSAPDISDIEGFQVRYAGPSTRMSIVNGRVSTSITHIYTLIPLKTGTFQIGPLSVTVNGQKLTSEPITVKVVSGSSSYPRKQSLPSQPAAEELKDRIFLTMEVSKSRIYVNEVIPLTIKLYVNQLAVRDIQYPQVAHQGFSLGEFDKPRQYRQNLGGVIYDVIEFHTHIFAVKPGKLTLGPVKLNCNIIVHKQSHRRPSSFDDFFNGFFDNNIFDDFFNKYQTYPFVVTVPEIPITVLALPEENKPSDFKGAVGNFQLEAGISPREVKTGDPVTLTMTVSGEGNFDTVAAPVLQSGKGFKVYEPEVNQKSNTKIFKQVLIPQSEAVTNIPEISFSFFDPKAGVYRTISRGPFAITVTKPIGGGVKVIDNAQGFRELPVKEHLGRDIVYIKESPGRLIKKGEYLYKKTWYWFIQIAVFIAFIILVVFYKHNERLRTDLRYARKLAAPKKAKKGIQQAHQLLKQGEGKEFFETVFRTLREYLSDRLHLPGAAMTIDTIEPELISRGIKKDMLEKLRGIFKTCDLMRYAPLEVDRTRMGDVFKDMKEVIDYFQRWKI